MIILLKLFLKRIFTKTLVKAVIKISVKKYVEKTETPVDDKILSMIEKISNDQSPEDEIKFLFNHFVD